MRKVYGILLVLVVVLAGCGYKLSDVSEKDGITIINATGDTTDSEAMNEFCSENKGSETRQTECNITNSDGVEQTVTIENPIYQEIERNTSDGETTITYQTNVIDQADLDDYCTNNLDPEERYTKCVYKQREGTTYQVEVPNPELVKEISYFTVGDKLHAYDKQGELIKSYDKGFGNQAIITPGYIYFADTYTYDSGKSSYQVFDIKQQEFTSDLEYNGPSTVSYSNGHVLLSKYSDSEVCELDGVTESNCFKTDSSTDKFPTDAWYDGKDTVYVVTTTDEMSTSLQMYSTKGELTEEQSPLWYGAGATRFYELEPGNPTLFTPNIAFPGELLSASFDMTLNDVLGQENIQTDFSKNLPQTGKEGILSLTDFKLFSINHRPDSQPLNYASGDAFNMNLEVPDPVVDTHVPYRWVIRHPYYVNNTTHKFSDFYYYIGGEGIPDTDLYSYTDGTKCDFNVNTRFPGYKFTCEGKTVVEPEDANEYFTYGFAL